MSNGWTVEGIFSPSGERICAGFYLGTTGIANNGTERQISGQNLFVHNCICKHENLLCFSQPTTVFDNGKLGVVNVRQSVKCGAIGVAVGLRVSL